MAMLAATSVVLTPTTASAQVINSECYALPDNASQLYILQLDTLNPGPVTIVPLDRTYTGEGMAYDPVTSLIYAWRGQSDREMWSIDPATGDETLITNDFDGNFPNLDQVQGASVEYNRATLKSTLHVLVDDHDLGFMVYEVDTVTGNASNPIGPASGSFSNPASLAISPIDGKWYVTRDFGTRRLGEMNPLTGAITTLTDIAGNPDAEGLDFADDTEVYVEEDSGLLGGRHIYQLDKQTGELSVATQTIPGSGDIEGISCNANSTAVTDPCSAVGEGAGGNAVVTVDVSATSGDIEVDQMVLQSGGWTYVYNGSAEWVRNNTSSSAVLESLLVTDGSSSIRLDEFNLSSADVGSMNYPVDVTGVRTSENGTHTEATSGGFTTALERVYDGTDLRDYLDHSSVSPAETSWDSDYSVMFDDPLDNDDYVVAVERNGDDEYVIEALDVNGNVVGNSHAVRVRPNYRWNTGYAPSDSTTEPMWLTVFDVEKFNVTTMFTPIYGFRVNNDDGAELKLIGASDAPFATNPAEGGVIDIQSGAWTGGGLTWSAAFGTGTVTATLSAPLGTVTAIGPGTMDASTYSQPTVSGADAFVVTHAHGTEATLSYDFGRLVTDPVLHMGRIGGYSGNPSQSHSSYLELGGGLTWTKLAANDTHFMTTPNAVWRQAGTVLDWRKTGEIGGPTWGTAAGSMQVNGTVSSIIMTITNAEPMGVEDLIEFVWTGQETLPSQPAAGDCGEITAVKTASATEVPVGGSVDWYLDAQSTGPLDIGNVRMQDTLPATLRAISIYTGRWTPMSQQAQIDINIDGAWTTVGTFDGNDEGSYALPPGVDEVRAVFLGDLPVNFDMTNPIRVSTDVINPDRDGVTHTLPIAIQNCVDWVGDNMAAEQQCASIWVPNETARPDVTIWSESTGLLPGDVASFRVRIKNDWAASVDLIDPFLVNLLPAQFEYSSWTSISTGFTPTLSIYGNYDGTGRELLKWDFAGHRMVPGGVYDLRVYATVKAGTAAGDYSDTVNGGTNDTTYLVACDGATVADINDLDLDGDRLEDLCSATTTAGTTVVPAVLSVSGTAFAEGSGGLPQIGLVGGGGPAVNGSNLALDGTASQKSTGFGGVASRSIDGMSDGSWTSNSVTHTNFESQPYLDIDLGGIYDLNEIVLWNRTDCCSYRLDDVWVFASDNPFGATSPSELSGTTGVWSAYLAGQQASETHVPVVVDGNNGTVGSHQKISHTVGNLSTHIGNGDRFGASIAGPGDIDDDGIPDMVVGAYGDDDGSGSDSGAVYVLFLNTDGTVKAEQKISDTIGGLSEDLGSGDRFGSAVAGIGDLDNDGVDDIIVGAYGDDDGSSGDSGAVYVLFLNTDGTVKAEQKISDTIGGLSEDLGSGDRFGSAVAGIGDLDNDGVEDVLIGAYQDDDGSSNRGAAYVLFLNTDGTVKAEQKISATDGGLGSGLGGGDNFGIGVGAIGDLDGDGNEDVVVGAYRDDDGGSNRGAVYVLFLNANGTVKSKTKISDTTGGLSAWLGNDDRFGVEVSGAGDVDNDGVGDIIVGAHGDDDGGWGRGAAYVLFLDTDGTVKGEQKISDTSGNFAGSLGGDDNFGVSLAGLGDINGDGVPDVATGAYGDDDGGSNRGATYVMNLTRVTNSTVTGRYIRVQLDGSNYLSLAEVEVFEKVSASSCPVGGLAVYSCAALASSNASAAFEYEISNDGNVAVDDLVMVAFLPQVGDVGLTAPALHTSEWRAELESAASVLQSPTGSAVSFTYSHSSSPCRPELNGLAAGTAWPTGCSDDWGPLTGDLTTVTAIRAHVTFAGSAKWIGGEKLRIRAAIEVGQGSPNADRLGLSSFGYRMNVASTGAPVGAVETDPAAIIIPRGTNGIGDLVWDDEDGDGIQDVGETGRNGVQVQLYGQSGVLLETVVTAYLDNDTSKPGHYWFGDLAPGTYYVQFQAPPIGLNVVTADQGGDDTLDSDASPFDMRTGDITLGAGQVDLTNDVGYFVPAGPMDCISLDEEFDPTDTDVDRREVNDPRPCPG